MAAQIYESKEEEAMTSKKYQDLFEYVFLRYVDKLKRNPRMVPYSLLTLSVVLAVFYIFYVIYKSYCSPKVYVQDFTEVGFDRMRSGPDRAGRIALAQKTRRLGEKLPPPYPNGWFAILESSDLKVGRVVTVDALGYNFCVYRGRDRVARCVDAYCPHLGANLGVGGAVIGNCIQCPFHHWLFGEDGALVSVPGSETVPKGVSIKTWTVKEADGAVWVWHDAEGREPLWELVDAPELSNWGLRGKNEYTVGCHIQEIPENGADVAHLNAVHSPSLRKYPNIHKAVGKHDWTAEWTSGEDHTATIKLTHNYRVLNTSFMHMDVHVTQIGPGHVRLQIQTPFGPILISQSVTPIAPLRQKIIHRVYSPKRNAVIGHYVNKAESNMIERDIAIWNNKRYVSAPTYVRTDRTIRAFRSWFSQFYSENSVSFRDAHNKNNTLDW